MTIDEAIHDLEAFKEYFIETTDSEPLCFGYAIDILTKHKNEEFKQGKWKPLVRINYSSPNTVIREHLFECSECGRVESIQEPYCNCGAKMDGKE